MVNYFPYCEIEVPVFTFDEASLSYLECDHSCDQCSGFPNYCINCSDSASRELIKLDNYGYAICSCKKGYIDIGEK